LLACSRMFFEGAHTFFQQHFTLLFPMSHKCHRLIICTRVWPDSDQCGSCTTRIQTEVCLLIVCQPFKEKVQKTPIREESASPVKQNNGWICNCPTRILGILSVLVMFPFSNQRFLQRSKK
jgi:hypothetical protein